MPPDLRGGGWTAEDLIEQFADYVYNVAARLTRDREEARDLAQDSFVMIMRGAGTFRGEVPPAAWIGRVVLNCHRNRLRWWRRLRRGRPLSLDGPAGADPDGAPLIDSIPDAGPDPEALAAGAETRERIAAALARLPHDHRAILVLREIEGLSYPEIAFALGVAEGTVKSRLARARLALRTAMNDSAERSAP